MSTQPPVRYENYPPEGSATPSGSPGDRTPVVRPYVPATIPPPQPTHGSSRRTVIGLVIGIPIAVMVVGGMAARDDPDPSFVDEGGNSDEGGDMQWDGEEVLVGDHSATVPEGWTVQEDSNGTVEVTNGANRLTAVLIDTATSTVAVEEIAPLAKRHYTGFSGKIGDPVDRSSAVLQHATMDGAGRFQGKVARLLAELWIDDTGTGLLITRVLTAKASSHLSAQSQEMVDELSGNF